MNLFIPKCTVVEQSTENLQIDLLVTDDIPYFAGHFATSPILAGVVQVGWIIQLANQHLGSSSTVETMSQLKFNSPITIGDNLHIAIDFNSDKNRLNFKIKRGATPCSSGAIALS